MDKKVSTSEKKARQLSVGVLLQGSCEGDER
jgi:hypothetical protein